MQDRKRDTDVYNRLLDIMEEGEGGMIWENSIETCILSRVKQIASPGWMHETSARGWCTGMTQREGEYSVLLFANKGKHAYSQTRKPLAATTFLGRTTRDKNQLYKEWTHEGKYRHYIRCLKEAVYAEGSSESDHSNLNFSFVYSHFCSPTNYSTCLCSLTSKMMIVTISLPVSKETIHIKFSA